MVNEELYNEAEMPGLDDAADMMEAECLLDENVLDFLEKHDVAKPMSADKVMIPEQLAAQTGYCGPLYGYIRMDSGYHVVLGWQDNMPGPVMKADCVGYIGECADKMPSPRLVGKWENGALEMRLVWEEGGEEVPLKTDIYTMKQDVFSRNSGLIETSWMVLQINPQAQVKRFYQRIQEVPREKYQEWISPENAIFIGTCDNRVGDAVACDLAYSFGAPFAALGFMTRAWAGEIYTCLPERHEICYRCAFKTQIENSIAEERRNHFYIGEEELEKAHFEPGLDVDLEFGISLFNKVVLDILNRNNPQYTPRLYHKMTQFTVFTGTDDRTFADPFWRKAFPTPIALRSLRHSDSCRRCEYCTK